MGGDTVDGRAASVAVLWVERRNYLALCVRRNKHLEYERSEHCVE